MRLTKAQIATIIAALAVIAGLLGYKVVQDSPPVTTTTSTSTSTSTSTTTSTTLIPNATYVDSVPSLNAALADRAVSRIEVRPGGYNISATINRPVTIECLGVASTFGCVMDGGGTIPYALIYTANAKGSVLRGFTIQNYNANPDPTKLNGQVNVSAANMTIEDNTFTQSKGGGLSIVGAAGVTVRNNQIIDNAQLGLHVHKADNIVIDSNIVTGNNIGNYPWFGGNGNSAGIKITKTKGAHVTANDISNNHSSGLWFDLQDADSVISANTLQGNLLHGVFYEVSTRATIGNNVVSGNGGNGVELSGSNSSTLQDNTITGNATNTSGIAPFINLSNIKVQEDPRTPANDANCAAGASYGADCNSYNNTVQS